MKNRATIGQQRLDWNPVKTKIGFFLPFLVLTSFSLQAQKDSQSDTLLPSKKEHSTPLKKFLNTLIVPTLFMGAAAYSIQYRDDVHDYRTNNYPKFKTSADDYLQYLPIAVVYGLDIAGVHGKHDAANQTVVLAKAGLLMTAIVLGGQYSARERRPDNSNFRSFPSGHVAQAFIAATVLQKEFGHLSVWYSIGGYAAASGIGVLRILNNKHWVPDVFVGAGIGVLTTNLAYLTHKYHWGKNYKKKKKGEAFLMPTFGNGQGIYFCYRFK